MKLSDELADDSKAVLQWSLSQIECLVEDTRRLAQENAVLWRKLGAPKKRNRAASCRKATALPQARAPCV
jgi:hypothetical protein